MADIFTAKCEDCGNIFSANFGIYRSICRNIDKSIKDKYGEKIYSQYMEMLEKVEKEIDFDIKDYDYFEIARVHDLDYKRKMLISRKENAEYSFNNFKKMIERSKEEFSEEFLPLKEMFLDGNASLIKEIEKALDSKDSKLIDDVYNNKIKRTRRIFEERLFICPECGNMDNKFYLGIFSGDYEYALKTKCSECNVNMISYNSFGKAIEEKAFCCTKCGSDKLTIERALHLD